VDLDGVLVDSHPSHIRAWRRLLAKFARRMSKSDLELVRDGRRKEEMLRYFLGNLSDDQVHAYSRLKDKFFRDEMHAIKAIEGVRGLLGQLGLDGIPMAVASCGGGVRVRQTLGRLRLGHYFTAVVTGDDVATGKPDPEIFRKAAARMRVRPADSIAFED